MDDGIFLPPISDFNIQELYEPPLRKERDSNYLITRVSSKLIVLQFVLFEITVIIIYY